METTHPTCPKCKGLLKYEPADILGPERVKCILCGWEKHRPAPPAPLRPETAEERPKQADSPKPRPERKPTFGTCPSCKRIAMSLKHGGICGRCSYRKTNGIDVLLPNHTPGILAPRAEQEQQQTNTKPETKENSMAKTTGTCPVCKRPDRKMNGTKCPRCYSRIAKGLDPLTGEPVKLLRAHDLEPADRTAVGKAVPARSETPAAPSTGFNLDVLAAIDEAWQGKREAVLLQLRATDRIADKLRLAHTVLHSVNTISIEA